MPLHEARRRSACGSRACRQCAQHADLHCTVAATSGKNERGTPMPLHLGTRIGALFGLTNARSLVASVAEKLFIANVIIIDVRFIQQLPHTRDH